MTYGYKALAFDIGDVLISVDFTNFISWIDKSTGNHYGAEQIYNKLESLMFHDFVGNIVLSKELEKEFKIKQTLIKEEWNKTLTINDQMVSFLKEAKKSCKIFALSNMGKDHYEYLQSVGFFSIFNDLHISFKVGAAKPSLLFFQSFLARQDLSHYKLTFDDFLFIDDREENLEGAKDAYFDTFEFSLKENTPIEDLYAVIKQYH